MSGRIAVLAVLIALGLIWPSVATANAGTSFMWLEASHLVVGNLLLGLLEGAILKWMSGGRWTVSLGAMVAANYMSAGVFLALRGSLKQLASEFAGQDPLLHLPGIFCVLLLVSFVSSVLLEWPLVRLALVKGRCRWARAFGYSALLQTVSYAALVPLYLTVSGLLLFSVDMRTLERSPSDARLVFFSSDGALRMARLDGTGQTDLAAGPFSSGSSLAVTPLNHGSTVSVTDPNRTEPVAVPVSDYVPVDAKAASSVRWSVFTSWGSVTGFDRKTGAHWSIGVETPVFRLQGSDPTVLDGELLIAGLGEQIVLVDLVTMKLAPVVNGRAPVVLRATPAR